MVTGAAIAMSGTAAADMDESSGFAADSGMGDMPIEAPASMETPPMETAPVPAPMDTASIPAPDRHAAPGTCATAVDPAPTPSQTPAPHLDPVTTDDSPWVRWRLLSLETRMESCREQSPGKPTTRRYSQEEKAAAVRMVRTLRAELGHDHGTIKRVADQLGYVSLTLAPDTSPEVDTVRQGGCRPCPLLTRLSSGVALSILLVWASNRSCSSRRTSASPNRACGTG